MKSSSKMVFAAATAVAAVLLTLPAVSRAQDRPKVTSQTPGTEGEDPFRAFEKYDSEAPVILVGTVSHVYWTNPHVRIDVDVKDANGKVTTWAVLGYPPNTLKRSGLLGEEVKDGDTVTIHGFSARDGSSTAGGHEITLADGTKKVMGPQSSMNFVQGQIVPQAK